jgi:DNA-binding NarL/FixJ family response regulator
VTNRVRVLIADDHPVVREGLRLMLGDAHEQIEVVGEASSGEEAVRLATTLDPDVVLMDLLMPAGDGVQATRRLTELGSRCRVLVLTSYGNDEQVRDAIRAGAIGVLLKDARREAVLDAILAAASGVATLHPSVQQQLMRDLAEPKAPSPFDELAPRERDVLRLIAAGSANKEIAAELNLSVGTVKGYVSAVLEKLGVADRTQAALLAVKHGFE